MNNLILKNKSTDLLKACHSFSEVLNLATYTEAWRFYHQCRKKLLHINSWNNPKELNYTGNFQLYDAFGYEVLRPAQVGDYIRIPMDDQDHPFLYLEIENINYNHQCDGNEESLTLMMKACKAPRRLVEDSERNSYQMMLKRNGNCIKADVQLLDKTSPKMAANQMQSNNFNWKHLLKYMLKQN